MADDSLKDLLEQIERKTNALGKPITIKINAPAQKVVAMADRRYLHRVVQNLAGNALRYANSTIIVSAGIHRNIAFVSVEDDGHGIPEADREKVDVFPLLVLMTVVPVHRVVMGLGCLSLAVSPFGLMVR